MALTNNEKWNAVIGCDHLYDGVFFYGVKTTGIFCRPSCKSKEPLRTNVEFFDEIEQAYHYGLRPCKRCRPDLVEFRPTLELVEKAKLIFDTYFAERYKLADQIKALAISQNHLINLFRNNYHMTPVEYINKLRVAKARHMLANTDISILNIALVSGFGSLSTFYQFFKKQVGLTPKEYRRTKNVSG